jgi:hypothetical protein
MFSYKIIAIFVIAFVAVEVRGIDRLKRTNSFERKIETNKSSFQAQMGRKLGDECIPGTCSSSNSNCKWQGASFKCVCKEKYIQINQTHCGIVF